MHTIHNARIPLLVTLLNTFGRHLFHGPDRRGVLLRRCQRAAARHLAAEQTTKLTSRR